MKKTPILNSNAALGEGTKVVWLSVIIVTVAQFAITYLLFFQRIFTTESISLIDGMLIIAIGIAFFSIIEIEKQLRFNL